MAWMVTVLLLGLWVLGMVSGATLGYWVHLLLLFAILAGVFALGGMAVRRRRTARV